MSNDFRCVTPEEVKTFGIIDDIHNKIDMTERKTLLSHFLVVQIIPPINL